MSEFNAISNTKSPNTLDTLKVDFQRLGIEEGDTVLVHSSLSSIGWVCGEESAVIDALLQTVGKNGTICMPAHSSGNSDPMQWCNPPVPKEWVKVIYNQMPAFRPEITPTRGMGRIAELFRKYPESIRSNHPQTSFSANGKNAKMITEKHVLTPQFGFASPLGKLYELNAKILLLGVGYNSCTSFHLAEAINECESKVMMGAAIEENHKRIWKWFEDYDYDCDDFEKLGNDLEEQGNIVIGNVGNAQCRLFGMQNGVNFAVNWLKVNRLKK